MITVTVFDDFCADVTVNGSFDGLMTIANNVDGTWQIFGSVRGCAGLLANEWDQIFGGSVLSDILVDGLISSLTTGSLFFPTSPGMGTFIDGAGAATGFLVVDGFGDVSPK